MSTYLLKRALPFALTLIMGVLLGSLFGASRMHRPGYWAVADESGFHHHRHCGEFQRGFNNAYNYATSQTIYRMPPAVYTEQARRDGIKGVVGLRLTLKSDGTISDITPVKELSDGLTEEAIKAARRIEFSPRYVNGYPTDSTQYVEYQFNGFSPVSDGPFRSFD
jgi:TonB family protein